MACSQVFICNSPTKLSNNWFPKNERSIATTVATSSNIFGVLAGYALPAFFIDNFNASLAENTFSDADIEKYKSQVSNM